MQSLASSPLTGKELDLAQQEPPGIERQDHAQLHCHPVFQRNAYPPCQFTDRVPGIGKLQVFGRGRVKRHTGTGKMTRVLRELVVDVKAHGAEVPDAIEPEDHLQIIGLPRRVAMTSVNVDARAVGVARVVVENMIEMMKSFQSEASRGRIVRLKR